MKKLILLLLFIPLFVHAQGNADCIKYKGQTLIKATIRNLIQFYYSSEDDLRLLAAKCGYVSPSEGQYMKSIDNHSYAITKGKGYIAMYINKDDNEFKRISQELKPYLVGLAEGGFSFSFTNSGVEFYLAATDSDIAPNMVKIYMTEVMAKGHN
ncbi:MAG: hypothetical protein JNK00_09875 [Flavipsychrobacter sp.]|nr:hypothetical protein [Flavipsychrobacter sp.]